jgi:hypothetical protein
MKSRIMFPVRKSLVLLSTLLLLSASVIAQNCTTGSDLDAATNTALQAAAHQFFDYAAHGDVFNMKQNAISSVQSSFGGIEGVVIDQKPAYTGAQAAIQSVYLLDASAQASPGRAEFFCGVWMTPGFASFAINNLPPGKYAVVTQNVTGPKEPYMLTLILKQEQSAWKLAGYYSKPSEIGGHDAQWYLTKAREYKSKGQNHDAWFYYLTAWDLMGPVDFMSTPKRDKVGDEMQSVRPADIPADKAVDLSAGSTTWKITRMFPERGNDGLVLVVKYQSADVSNTQKTFDDNMAVIKAVVNKYPEYRDAFAAVVARASDPSGHEYASLLAMKDVK